MPRPLLLTVGPQHFELNQGALTAVCWDDEQEPGLTISRDREVRGCTSYRYCIVVLAPLITAVSVVSLWSGRNAIRLLTTVQVTRLMEWDQLCFKCSSSVKIDNAQPWYVDAEHAFPAMDRIQVHLMLLWWSRSL